MFIHVADTKRVIFRVLNFTTQERPCQMIQHMFIPPKRTSSLLLTEVKKKLPWNCDIWSPTITLQCRFIGPMPVSCTVNLLDVPQDCQQQTAEEWQIYTLGWLQENEDIYNQITKKSWESLSIRQNKTKTEGLNRIVRALVMRLGLSWQADWLQESGDSRACGCGYL